MLDRNRKIIPLEEGFKELGLDPDKMIGAMEKNTSLVDERSSGTAGSGGPPLPSYGDPAHVSDQELLESGLKPDGTPMSPAELEEFKLVKTKKGSAAKIQRKKAKRARKKKKGKLKLAAKKYRKSAAGKKQLKKHARILKKIGGPKKGKRIFTHTDLSTDLEGLREDVNSMAGGLVDSGEDMASYEETALNASYLCALLAEVFDVVGEGQTAETLFQVSESGTSFSDDMEGFTTEDELSEEQTIALNELITAAVKGLRFWEGLGAPSLDEAIDMRMTQDALQG